MKGVKIGMITFARMGCNIKMRIPSPNKKKSLRENLYANTKGAS